VIATVRAGHGYQADGHEFLLTPQGTALVDIYHVVPFDLSPIGGPVKGRAIDSIVQEIDVATGKVLLEWHSLDHVGIAESHQSLAAAGPTEPFDYFHVNAVNLDTDGNLLISARNAWTIYKVDRHTGAVIWRLGGKKSDFQLGPHVAFAWQHNALPAGTNTIRIFDNESAPTVQAQSRVIWIHLDLAKKTATLARSLRYPGGISVPAEGDAEPLGHGHTFVAWGATGRISEFDAAGKLLFDAQLPDQFDTYRGYRYEWHAVPLTGPTATAVRHPDGTMTVDAIWNGATEVARWRVLAGPAMATLSLVATVDWNGSDTTTMLLTTARYVEVQALDAGGTSVGTSPAVAVAG
jgi:hypothetical protein